MLFKRLWQRLIGTQEVAPSEPARLTDEPAAQESGLFVYVQIPEQIGPVERTKRYEDPLQAFLDRTGIGEVSGGGTMLSAPDASGRKEILYCGIDVDLTSEQALAPFQEELVRLDFPKGTLLKYKFNGNDITVDIHAQPH